MKVSSALFIVVVLMAVISLLCIWFFPSIQDFMASNTMWNGIRHFCRESGTTSIESLDELPDTPEETTLIVIPYTEYTSEDLSRIGQFVNAGGTILLMDDYGYGNSILAYLGISVRFTNVPLLDPLFCYKNLRLPKIVDLAPDVKQSGIDTIVLNHATTLTNVAQTEIIARSSPTSFLDIDENESWGESEPRGPFPVAARLRYGKGTVAIVSDPSIMINSMAGRYDNYSFTRYLTASRDTQTGMLIDSSHLSKAPLDVSKTRLTGTREILSNPYPVLGFVAIIFVVVSRYTLKTGETSG